MINFLSSKNVKLYSNKYDQYVKGKTDELIENELRDWFKSHNYLNRKEFLKLCIWKSPRPKKSYENEINSDERIINISKIVSNTQDEYLRIKMLQLLSGVSWPVASTILHFMFPDQYMIMDFRSIWSLGMKQPKSYNYDYWMLYTINVRSIALKYNVSLRMLDKALWFYSKEHQDKTSNHSRSELR